MIALPKGALARIGTVKSEENDRPRPSDWQSLAFLPDGKTIASFDRKKKVRVLFWNPVTGKLLSTFTPHAPMGSWRWSWVSLSPDAKIVAALGYDEAADKEHRNGSYVGLWARSTGKALHKLWMPADINKQVAFSRDGRLVAAGESEGRVRVWTVANGKQVADLHLWPRKGDTKIELPRYTITHISFSPDSKTTAVLGRGRTIHLCDPRTGRQLRSWEVRGGGSDLMAESVAFSPDWKQVACGTSTGRKGGSIWWWDVGTQKFLRRTESPEFGTNSPGQSIHPGVTTLDFSPDGQLLASGDHSKAVRLWDVKTGKEIAKFEGHKKSVTCVTFSPDGKTLASLSEDLTALIWKVPETKG
jgi:WD40 repeat protein